MYIHKDKCLELGLPEPKLSERQINYVIRLLILGYKFNTRLARYVGIHNLHSIISTLKKQRVDLTLIHGLAMCPYLKTTPSQPVDIVFMTPEQIIIYANKKAA